MCGDSREDKRQAAGLLELIGSSLPSGRYQARQLLAGEVPS